MKIAVLYLKACLAISNMHSNNSQTDLLEVIETLD